jgi:hypothetical protein
MIWVNTKSETLASNKRRKDGKDSNEEEYDESSEKISEKLTREIDE